MLAGLATWVILGHSERRAQFGETDDLIGRKLDRAVAAGLRPILCVGEVLAEREAGRETAVVDAQLRGSLDGRDAAALAAAGLVIAYEPVWAIGTGRNASGADAAAMADAIRASARRPGLGRPGRRRRPGALRRQRHVRQHRGVPRRAGRSTAPSSAGRRSSPTRWPGSSRGPGSPRRPGASPGDRSRGQAGRRPPAAHRPRRRSTASASAGTRRRTRSPRPRCPAGAGCSPRWPHAVLQASEGAVGLPDGQMGNSEVGHLNLGAGRPVLQDLPRIDAAIVGRLVRPAARAARRLRAGPRDGPSAHRRPRRAGGRPRQRPAPARPRPRSPRRRASRRSASTRCSTAATRRRARRSAFVASTSRTQLADGAPGRADRDGRRPLLGDGPRPALGPDRARLRRDRPRGGGACPVGDGGDRGRVRPGRDRRVRRADGDRRASMARCATATRSSTSTSAPTAHASSPTPSPTRGFAAFDLTGPDGRAAAARTSSWSR